MGVIDELVTLIRFDMPAGATATLKKAESGISSLTGRLKDLGIVAVATGAVTAALSANAANEATELTKLSEATGLSTERLQALAAVYKEVGGSAANAGRDAAAFMQHVGKELDESTIDDLERYITGMDDARSIMTLNAMGFSDDIFRYLKMDRQFRKERMEYNKQNNTLGDEEKEKLADLSTAMAVFTTGLGDTSAKMQAALAPSITTALDDIVEWLDENEGDIVSGMEAIGGGFTRAWGTFKDFGEDASEALGPAWKSLDEFVNKHGGWEEAIGDLTVAVAGLGTALAAISVPKGLLTLAGMLTGLGRAGGAKTAGDAAGKAAGKGLLGRGVSLLGGVAGGAAAIALGGDYALRENAEAIADRQNALNNQIKEIKTASDAESAGEENWSNMLRGLASTDPLGAIDRYQKGEKAISRPIDELIAAMSVQDKHSYRMTENFDAALAKKLERMGYGRTNGLSQGDIDRLLELEEDVLPHASAMNKRFLNQERKDILGRAEPIPDYGPAQPPARNGMAEENILRKMGSSMARPGIQNDNRTSTLSAPITNNITITGVLGAAETASAVKDAAAMGAQSGVQSAFKSAFPDGFIGPN